jgi:hypothetical protein
MANAAIPMRPHWDEAPFVRFKRLNGKTKWSSHRSSHLGAPGSGRGLGTRGVRGSGLGCVCRPGLQLKAESWELETLVKPRHSLAQILDVFPELGVDVLSFLAVFQGASSLDSRREAEILLEVAERRREILQVVGQ